MAIAKILSSLVTFPTPFLDSVRYNLNDMTIVFLVRDVCTQLNAITDGHVLNKCKKSSCHKRYCECYESRVPCTSLCKCIGCKNTEQSVHPLNVGFYRSGQPKTTTQTPLDQIPRTGPPTETTIPNNVFNMEVTEALATCLLVTGQQCEMNQMNDLDSKQVILKEFQRCMYQIVQSALGRPPTSSLFN
ncbi:unnamed protein product [Rotaria sp. Silwood2]|nr:unnamed protein product [Rotaria sp. Silwood2]